MSRKKRIILAKLGLDGHDNGMRIVATWLRDNGYEVIYLGLYNSVDRVVGAAVEEDVDAIGISFLGGEHLYYSKQLLEKLNTNGLSHLKIFFGGVIPKADVRELKELGIAEIFTFSDGREKVLTQIDQNLEFQ